MPFAHYIVYLIELGLYMSKTFNKLTFILVVTSTTCPVNVIFIGWISKHSPKVQIALWSFQSEQK